MRLACFAISVAIIATINLPLNSDAFKGPSHSEINSFIAKNEYNIQSNFSSYVIEFLGFENGAKYSLLNNKISKWIAEGGEQEDTMGWDYPFMRFFNHFHDPVSDLGLHDQGLGTYDSTIAWAGRNEGTQRVGGNFSWRDTRAYFYHALTAATKDERDENFALTFRGVGQLMHLVQDMSVPEHTRNDPHVLPAYESWVKNAQDPRNGGYSIFQYALANPAYPSSTLLVEPSSVPSLTALPVANIIDSSQYDGTNPDITLRSDIGLSEYTNANFVSIDTLFKDFGYPANSPTSVRQEPRNIPDPFISGATIPRQYNVKIGDGDSGYLLAGVDYLYYYRTGGYVDLNVSQEYVVFPPMDNNVFSDYGKKLIPRAVGYSAALLDYFFRGTIELTLPDPPDERLSTISLKARNTTANGEAMTNPEEIMLVIRYIQMQEDPAHGKIIQETVPDGQDGYHYIVVPITRDESGNIPAIPRDSTVDLDFDLSETPLPIWAYDVTLQVVFKGQLGNESGAVAVGITKLTGIGGDIELTRPQRGVYGITKADGSFTEFRMKAANASASTEAMNNGKIELILWYRQADESPFMDRETEKSPPAPEFYYTRIEEKNGVRSIPIGSSTELVFDLSQKPIPLWATDVRAYVLYTGQVGEKTNELVVGFRDVAEPTPIDIINNMDYVCISGNYLAAGSQESIDAVGTDLSGRPSRDIYPHRLKDIYLAFTPTPASSENYSAKVSDIEPGQYSRVLVLPDYEFNFSSAVSVENIYGPLEDVWGLAFGNSVAAVDGVTNQEIFENGEYIDYYPGMYTERELKSWWYKHYENPKWPAGTTCDRSGALTLGGPVAVEISP